MEWRVIRLEVRDAFTNMALDEAASEAVRAGESPPTIRFYRWSPSAVSIGFFQELEKEVSLGKCRELGVDWVRRRTGGGAVYHDYNGEITYSVIAPERFFPKDVIKSYEEVCGWIISGLSSLGVSAEFSPINDVLVNGKKVSGNAQTRRQGILLQHGTVLYDVDPRRMFAVLNVPEEKISDKLVSSVEDRVTCLKKSTGASMKEVEDALLKGFTSGKEWGEGAWSKQELERAEELAESKYKTREWNKGRL